ncbi:crotonase/enoyl-CoA hydratase family protein [Corynebacterium sp. H78]|uniref:crotonase/enoyl-CoA hydratase family protein n=1 Tax=Corynebacterium sp. H78 TaxID=3133417 RepID=UPI0030A27969
MTEFAHFQNISVSFEQLSSDGGDVAGKVAVVKLNRPEKLNGLTIDMLRDLSTTARTLARDPELRGIILAGEGASFCAGLDFGSALQPTRSARFALATGFLPDIHGTNVFQRACWDWRRVPVPVIAIVHGHCYGGGLQIALGADFRITTADSRWSVLETKWGLIPDMSGIRTLTDQLPLDQAKWLTMSGEELSGASATNLGLATTTAPDLTAATEEAWSRMHRLVGRSPDQLAATKRLYMNTSKSPRATFRAERIEQLMLFARENTVRARSAALKKVAPRYARRGTWLGRG